MSLSFRQKLLGLCGLLLCLGAYTWATHEFFSRRYNGGNDFFSRYVAWRAFLLEDRNPYSDEVTREIQIAINGRPARPGEDENALIYPWYAVVVQWPFVFLPWAWARAAYMVICQIIIAVGLALTARLLKWQLSPRFFTFTVLWAILFYPEARGIILGQIVITQYLFGVLTLWLMHKQCDNWAGVCLALSTVKPTPVFLFVPAVLLFALVRRRWRLAWAFGLTLGILCLAGFVFLPTWLTDWLYRLGRYPAYTVGQSPIWLLTHQVTALGDAWEWGLVCLCLAGLGAAWWLALRRSDDAAFHWTLGLTLVVSSLIVYRSATTSYIFLLFPTYLLFAALARTWPRAGPWIIVALQIAGLIGLWWLFAATVQGDQEQAIMYIPLPVFIGLALLIGRRWLIRDNQKGKVQV